MRPSPTQPVCPPSLGRARHAVRVGCSLSLSPHSDVTHSTGPGGSLPGSLDHTSGKDADCAPSTGAGVRGEKVGHSPALSGEGSSGSRYSIRKDGGSCGSGLGLFGPSGKGYGGLYRGCCGVGWSRASTAWPPSSRATRGSGPSIQGALGLPRADHTSVQRGKAGSGLLMSDPPALDPATPTSPVCPFTSAGATVLKEAQTSGDQRDRPGAGLSSHSGDQQGEKVEMEPYL